MLSFEDAATYLDDVVDELPDVILRELNGGISFVPHEKRNGKSPSMYILGEYIKNKQMGRYIVIYYGSFVKLHSNCTDEFVRKRLKEVLIHELTHHNESLAGDHDLELKDIIQQNHFLNTGKYISTKDIDLYNTNSTGANNDFEN